MEILFEDRYMVAAVKPSGTPSQPDPSGRVDMVSALASQCGCEIFCVHRLDTATAGVMVYAKSSQAAGRLTASVSEGRKTYLAMCRGLTGSGTMADLFWHDKRKNKSYVVDRRRAGVKEALLDYECVGECGGVSLVRVTLHTGRTHQIRVQFSSRGYPLIGDGKYGSKDKAALALRCVELEICHPYTGKPMLFSSPWNDNPIFSSAQQ